MPTTNPRVTVTLKPSTFATLRRLSALTKNSQSAIIGELLEASEPVFERTCRVLEAAQTAQASVRESVKANLEQAEAQLSSQLGLMLGELHERSSDMVDTLEKVTRRTRGTDAAAAGTPPPPSSNRGGATLHPTRSAKRKARAKGKQRRRS